MESQSLRTAFTHGPDENFRLPGDVGDWSVSWRAVDPDGAPDQFCAMRISSSVVKSAAHAILLAQTHREHIVWKRCPGRAFVDWQATQEA